MNFSLTADQNKIRLDLGYLNELSRDIILTLLWKKKAI